MPRIGMNPARGRMSDYKPSRVTLATITHAPDLSGYFEHRLDVMRLSLESLIANTTPACDLMVFDNGSCKPVVDSLRALRDAGKIQYLILSSQNIGKIGAQKILFNAAPGEIVAYTDDDIFFLPGWLEESLKIMDTFPNVGIVGSYYVRSHRAYGVNTASEFAKQPGVEVQHGKIIDRQWEQHYIDNMGRTWERYNQEVEGLEDTVLKYKGVEAYVASWHLQYIAQKRALLEALPNIWGGQMMGQMVELDAAVDKLGYMRLSTRQPMTRLLGNTLDAESEKLARTYGLEAKKVELKKSSGVFGWFFRRSFVKRIARYIYNRLYRVINM
jgi:glycosyltransferase involved in cell wall biosynthesis